MLITFYLTPDSEDDLSSLSESSSLNSTPQSESRAPLSPKEFWKEKAGESVVRFTERQRLIQYITAHE